MAQPSACPECSETCSECGHPWSRHMYPGRCLHPECYGKHHLCPLQTHMYFMLQYRIGWGDPAPDLSGIPEDLRADFPRYFRPHFHWFMPGLGPEVEDISEQLFLPGFSKGQSPTES